MLGLIEIKQLNAEQLIYIVRARTAVEEEGLKLFGVMIAGDRIKLSVMKYLVIFTELSYCQKICVLICRIGME